MPNRALNLRKAMVIVSCSERWCITASFQQIKQSHCAEMDVMFHKLSKIRQAATIRKPHFCLTIMSVRTFHFRRCGSQLNCWYCDAKLSCMHRVP